MSAENNLNQAPQPGTTRLHYTGQNIGSIDFQHPQSGQFYQGGKNTRDEYQDVPKADAAWLVSTGRFVVVEIPAEATWTVAQRDEALLKMQQAAEQAQAEADKAAADAQAADREAALQLEQQNQAALADEQAQAEKAAADEQAQADAQTSTSKSGSKKNS